MLGLLKGISTRYFSGTTRQGPRHAYLLHQLRRRGCECTIDRHGNIWVEKGKGRPLTLFSSHIDVDPRIRKPVLRATRERGRLVFHGVLDNSAGCCANVLLASRGPRRGRAIYVFTASEEVHRHNPRRFASSAREVVRELRGRGLKPDLCVAIDATHPRLLKPQEKLDWARHHSELFDSGDPTHCYIDGYTRRDARKLGIRLVRKFGDWRVSARRFAGHDEAHVYSHLCKSFAFGPVVYGHMDRPGQRMPLAHLKTALKFLRRI